LNDISKHNSHLDTGIVGVKYLLPVLTAINRTDLAYTIATKDDYPSWGWMIKNGATTLWENWPGDRYTTYGSRNHIMFGSQSDWYFKVLGGINLVPGTVGWTNILYKPDVNGLVKTDLTSVSSSIRTHRGLIESSWHRYTTSGLCSTADENTSVQLICIDGTISSIQFASFGTPTGTCGNFKVDSNCNAKNSTSVVSSMCLGKTSCTITANDALFGDPCFGVPKRLYVQVGGCAYPIFVYAVRVPVNSDGEIYIPKVGQRSFEIMELGKKIWTDNHFVPGVSGITSGEDMGESVKFVVGSGDYTFTINPSDRLIAK